MKPVLLNDLPMLSSAHAESMIRAMEASVQVRRRSQFFVWAQSCLQALLPHQVLVCGAYQRLRRELQFDVFQGVIVPPEALSLLGDARSALWRELVRCWVDGGARPVQVDTATLGRLIGETEATSLAGSGLRSLLVHGVARPQRLLEVETMFLFASTTDAVPAQAAFHAELLLPHLHATWLRMLATERDMGTTPTATQVRADDKRPPITDRECQILSGVREGKTNQQIAEELGISALTVKNHVQKILRKLGAANRAQAVAMAMRMNLLGSPLAATPA
jgi:transcriptional regulator EpsA